MTWQAAISNYTIILECKIWHVCRINNGYNLYVASLHLFLKKVIALLHGYPRLISHFLPSKILWDTMVFCNSEMDMWYTNVGDVKYVWTFIFNKCRMKN